MLETLTEKAVRCPPRATGHQSSKLYGVREIVTRIQSTFPAKEDPRDRDILLMLSTIGLPIADKAARMEIRQGLTNLFLRVHHDRTMPCNRLL
jgi:hypothetical protein